MVHAVRLEQVRQVALVDRQAELTAALMLHADNYTPIDVEGRVSDWEARLASDPTAPSKPGESFADRVAQFEQQVQALDQMTEVA